jgi:hypothetical protein
VVVEASPVRELQERRFETAVEAITGLGRRRWVDMLDSEWKLNEERPEHVARFIRSDLAEAAEALAMYLDPEFDPA